MATVQGINHLDTIIMGFFLQEVGLDPAILERFSTPILRTKMEIIQKVFSHPALYAEIIALNPYLRRMTELYQKTFADIKLVAEKGISEDLRRLIEQRKTGPWAFVGPAGGSFSVKGAPLTKP
jgi:prephenate dehydrogenase